jgi:hypothetical protein
MSLIGNMIDDAVSGNPSVVNYAMFVAVFSMLSLIYLILAAWTESAPGHPIIPLTLDVLNTLFFFCGAVALAAKLHVHSCNNKVYLNWTITLGQNLTIQQDYILHNSITNGAPNRKQRCQEAQASTAFLWFGFACYAASTFFSTIAARGGGVNLRSGGIRRGGPAMSQV